MTPMPTSMPATDLDALLADFFRAELTALRPTAPVAPAAGVEVAPPAPTPRVTPAPDRAKVALAASFAVVLGTCWLAADGFHPADRGMGAKPVNRAGVGSVLPAATAADPAVLKELRKGGPKAADPAVFTPGPIQLP